jgi:hypothetical protein
MAKGKKTGGGSRKGVPNKATADVRAAIATLAEECAPKLIDWLREVEDPREAHRLVHAPNRVPHPETVAR